MPIFGCCLRMKCMLPDVGCSRPARTRRRVVFPEPDGPRKQMKSRGHTSNEISSSARRPLLLSGKTTLRSFTVRMGLIFILCRGEVMFGQDDLAPTCNYGMNSFVNALLR